MKLTPRADEYKAVLAIMESDEYKTGEAMAKAVVKQVAEMLWNRDWVALSHHFEGNAAFGINWGPFSSDSEALALARKIGLNGRFGTVHLGSPGALLANVEGKPGAKGYCQTPDCGHAPFVHLMNKNGKQRGVCPLGTCDCTSYQK